MTGTRDARAPRRPDGRAGIDPRADDRRRRAGADRPQMTLDDEHAERVRTQQAHVRALAANMLEAAGASGVTAYEIRHAAEQRGMIREDEPGRSLSWLAAMLRGVGAVPTTFRKSKHKGANGRHVRVWVLRKYLDQGAEMAGGQFSADEARDIVRAVRTSYAGPRERAFTALRRVGWIPVFDDEK